MAATWTIIDHICAICLGRLLQHSDGTTTRCSNCGTEKGKTKELCCCGIRLKNNKDAGIRCQRNQSPSPELPGEIIAEMQD